MFKQNAKSVKKCKKGSFLGLGELMIWWMPLKLHTIAWLA